MVANLFELEKVNMDDILLEAVKKEASDVHLSVGKPPVFRVNGRLSSQGADILTPPQTIRLTEQVMPDKIRRLFEENMEADFSHVIESGERFRANVFTQKGTRSAVFRLIPNKIKTLEELNMPEVLKSFTLLPRGLVLVTGPTGSGKSTTLTSMIDLINTNKDVHIITLEDPIEYVHQSKMSIVNQREIGQDSLTFKRALRSVLREDPDVILLGEMRDLETISTAVTLAETGHLVFATLHTTNAAQTVDRIIDVFPSDQQEQIRFQLSNVLEAIVTQTLLPCLHGGRICATEILIMTSAARSGIRNNKTNTLNDIMQMSAKHGMQTLEQSLYRLYKGGMITADAALSASSKPDILKQMMGNVCF